MLHLFMAVGPIALFGKYIHLLTPLQVSQFCSAMAFYVAFIITRLLLPPKKDSRQGLDAE